MFQHSIKNSVSSQVARVNSEEDSNNGSQHKEPRKSPKKPRRPANRFGDMSEEDVLRLTLPEHLGYNLDILFVSVSLKCTNHFHSSRQRK